jgi:hypothetical protein
MRFNRRHRIQTELELSRSEVPPRLTRGWIVWAIRCRQARGCDWGPYDADKAH